ncbi:N-acetylmuramoyl-L-alanine amidase [Levilactobacillus enshiensis]|uniref:N-acetylmuramoyl-L-alanine amidase n=1 Tax=Levilactobacillus enshiensis TaxID=2590213 RepID=UPI001179C858|nr:N-acetylmuramoyl-L-alanine amidase [Levilactobacillus enshiensis]
MGYSLNHSYELAANAGDNRKTSPQYITAHDTGNDSNKGVDSGKREASYMCGHWQNAYTHAIVDDQGIYIVGTPGYIAYGAGSPANERSPFQVELAHVDSQKRFNESYKRYIWVIRYYASKYSIPLTLDGSGNGIKTHKWVSDNLWGNHQDPYGYLAKWGISKSQFAKDLKTGVGGSSSTPAKKATYLKAAKQVKAKTNVTRYHDKEFKKKELTFNSGTVFDIASVVSYGKITRLKLGNGLYITSNTDYVKKLK